MDHGTISEELSGNVETLAADVIDTQFGRQPKLLMRMGEIGRKKCFDDTRHTIRYLAESIALQSPGLFANYLVWLGALLESFSVPREDLVGNVEIIRDVLGDHFGDGPAMKTIDDYMDGALSGITGGIPPLEVFLDPDAPDAELAKSYLESLLSSDRLAARRTIIDAVDGGMPVRDVYLNVFQPVQREIGRLWQTKAISVAHEHYATAVTQLIMSELFPRIISSERIGLNMISTCIGGELHEVGIRMVSDFFEMAGWDTRHFGANTPMESILGVMQESHVSVAALSATMLVHVRAIHRLITQIRTHGFDDTVILVGGYPFNLDGSLWQKVGADGCAVDAPSAVGEAERLVRSRA